MKCGAAHENDHVGVTLLRLDLRTLGWETPRFGQEPGKAIWSSAADLVGAVGARRGGVESRFSPSNFRHTLCGSMRLTE